MAETQLVFPLLEGNDAFVYPTEVHNLRLTVEWVKSGGELCDLDLQILNYDERARMIERLDTDHDVSEDKSSKVLTDIQGSLLQDAYVECLDVNFKLVKQSTTAMVMYLEGTPRNYQNVKEINVYCYSVMSEAGTSFSTGLFKIQMQAGDNYHGMGLGVLYRNGWWHSNESKWEFQPVMRPVLTNAIRLKDEANYHFAIENVPVFKRYRNRLFRTVRDICGALSTTSLPKFKESFIAEGNELLPDKFVKVLFKQLYESHPRILEQSEAATAVAMLFEMFYQIDVNSDGFASWSEFTDYCVLNAWSRQQDAQGGSKNKEKDSQNRLDEYVIEYAEDFTARDHFLSPHRTVHSLRYIPEMKRLVLILHDSDSIVMVDENFRIMSQLCPSKVLRQGEDGPRKVDKVEKTVVKTDATKRVAVYDIVYLTGKDMYAFCCSDHTITICKEGMRNARFGTNANYLLINKIYHSMQHMKLCWNAKNALLCSIASDHTIFGWDILKKFPLFQVSRHEDIITDFISVEHLDVFVTCGMDKRIVIWSASTRRVKGW
jgi:WD40 repeat protein